MRKNGLVIAIDGTAGTGKSTVGTAVAQKLGYGFLSTGELYRALAYKVYETQVEPTAGQAVLDLAKRLTFTFVRQPNAVLKMYVDGEYLGAKLHLEEVGNVASQVSTHKEARAVLTEQMRRVGQNGGIIMEGRDIGTVVLPDADVKFYMTASAQERAKRRVKQLEEAGEHPDYDKILALIEERDYRDSHRAASPLRPAEGAVIIDTSALTQDEVVAKVLEKISHYAA